jgi:hypothetical protein
MDTVTTTERAKRPRRPRTDHAPRPAPSAPPVVAVVRRPDDTLCHARCGQPLAFQGVRALLEADFYCYRCLTHVSMPLAALDALPVTAGDERTTVVPVQ